MRDFGVLFSADQIQARVVALAHDIDATYAADDVLHIIRGPSRRHDVHH